MQLPDNITPLQIGPFLINLTRARTDLLAVRTAIPIALILLRVAYTQARRLIAGRTKSKMSYVVKWGRER